jgi:hypothetical protein
MRSFLKFVVSALLVVSICSILGCQSPSSSTGIVGKWEQVTRNGQKAVPSYTYVFSRDDTFVLVAPGAGTVSGTYTILEGGYVRTSANGAFVTQSYSIAGDVMTMSDGSHTSTYKRVK